MRQCDAMRTRVCRPKPSGPKNTERTSPKLTYGLVRDLIASDGDSIPVHRSVDAALKVRELDGDI